MMYSWPGVEVTGRELAESAARVLMWIIYGGLKEVIRYTIVLISRQNVVVRVFKLVLRYTQSHTKMIHTISPFNRMSILVPKPSGSFHRLLATIVPI